MGNCLFNKRSLILQENQQTADIHHQIRDILPSVYNPPWELKDECIVCMDKRINTVLIPCGHFIMCYYCTHNLCVMEFKNEDGFKKYPQCPMCRKNVESISLLYPRIVCVESI